MCKSLPVTFDRLAFDDRQVRACLAVVGSLAKQRTPLRGCFGVLSLPSVDDTQHVAGILLFGRQAQSGKHLLLRLGQHIAPFVDQAEIVVGFGLVRVESNGMPQCIHGCRQVAICEEGDPHVEKQVPPREPERSGAQILIEFLRFVARHSVRKAQMIVSERVGWMLLEELAMKTNRGSVILCYEIMIGRRVADRLLDWIGSEASQAAETNEQQRNRGAR